MKIGLASTGLIIVLTCASAASAQTVQQLRIQWTAAPAAPSAGAPAAAPDAAAAPATNPFRMIDRRSISGSLARQRDPQLSESHVLVQTVDALGNVLDSQLILDPRVIRSEASGASGLLEGAVLFHASPEFLLTIPELTGGTELRFYHPRWTGTGFALDLLGTMPLN